MNKMLCAGFENRNEYTYTDRHKKCDVHENVGVPGKNFQPFSERGITGVPG